MSENTFDVFKLDNPVKLGGTIPEDRAVFYELAKDRLEYQSRQENRAWQKTYRGKEAETSATYVVGTNNSIAESGNVSRWVNLLKIVVNKEIFEEAGRVTGEDYTDLIPYVVEHEIYEAWLAAKRGAGQRLPIEKQHLLAKRREFYLAAKDGRGEKLYRFQTFINPINEEEYKSALVHAQKRLRKKSNDT